MTPKAVKAADALRNVEIFEVVRHKDDIGWTDVGLAVAVICVFIYAFLIAI